jgi:hypothetical protein
MKSDSQYHCSVGDATHLEVQDLTKSSKRKLGSENTVVPRHAHDTPDSSGVETFEEIKAKRNFRHVGMQST